MRFLIPVSGGLRIGALIALATVAFAGLEFAGQGSKTTAVPPFVTRALGAPQPHAPLNRTPAPNFKVRLGDRNGVLVHNGKVAIGLAADVAGKSWESYENGVSRQTPFGVEAITANRETVEESLIVGKHQGKHTWSWQLESGKLVPRISADGGISFTSGRYGVSNLALAPPRVLDAQGRDITPPRAKWSLRGSTLSLRLDDSRLPVPYVIDPIIALSATCAISHSGNIVPYTTSTTSCTVSMKGGVKTLTGTAPSGFAQGDLLVAVVAADGNAAITAPTCSCWTLAGSVQTDGATGIAEGIYYKIAGATESGAPELAWSWTTSSTSSIYVLDYTGVDQATPLDPNAGSTSGSGGSSNTTPSITVSTNNSNTLDIAAVAVERNLTLTAGGTAAPTQQIGVSQTTGTALATEVEDATQTAAGTSGTFTSGVPTGPSARWVIEAAAFKPMPDGVGSMVLSTVNGSPTSNVLASSTGQTLVFTYSAPSSGLSNGTVELTVPSGWTAPSTSTITAGYSTSSNGALSTPGGGVIKVTGLTLTANSTFTITYGNENSGSNAGATAPATTGATSWTLQEQSTSGGALSSDAAGEPPVTINAAADGSGTMTPSPANASYASTGNTFAFTYTAAAGGISANGTVALVVPANWTTPQTTSNTTAGYTTTNINGGGASTSNEAVTGTGPWTVTVTLPTGLASGNTAVITYGDKSGGSSGATAPASAGSVNWTAQEKSTSTGTATSIATLPAINVYAADGSGTANVSPTSTLAGTSNNTETATYTPTTGGLAAGGVVTMTVPANWTAPQTTSSTTAGYTTANINGGGASTSNEGISGTGPWTVDVTLPSTLSSGQTIMITYGDTAGGANPGATATAPSPGQAGDYTFTTKEQSSSRGTLATVSTGNQTVTINNSTDGSGTANISPTSTPADTSNNTEVLTYTVATGGIATNGAATLAVPANWTAPQTTTPSAAGYVQANINGGGYTTGNVTTAGQTITVTTPSALSAGQTIVVSYGDSTGGSSGAVDPPAANAGWATWTVQEQSSSDGTLTTLSAGSPSVNVTISAQGAGSDQTLSEIPDLTGMTVQQASLAIQAAGFTVGTITNSNSGLDVVSQSPAAAGYAVDRSPLDFTLAVSPLRVALALTVSGSHRIDTNVRHYDAARIQVDLAATITATLTTLQKKTVATWIRSVKAGTWILRYPLPASLDPGDYKLTVAATTTTDRRAYTVPVEIKAGSFPVTGQAKVIVVGNAAGHSTLALELEPNTAAVTSSSSVFNVAESAKNVAVIVIDIDQQGVALVRNLHTVFPSDPIVAVTAHASHVEAARKNGASAAVVIDTPSAIVTAVVKAIIANKS